MRIDRYLIIGGREDNSGGIKVGGCRVTKNKPSLGADERVIRLELDIPDALFLQPQLCCKVTVPEDAVSRPEITAETVDNIKEVMSQELGVNMTIQVVDPTARSEG